MDLEKSDLIILRFFVNSFSLIPSTAKKAEDYTEVGMGRKYTQVTDSEGDCDISCLLEDMYKNGIFANNVLWRQKKRGYAVDFYFSQKPTDLAQSSRILQDLRTLSKIGFWRVWAMEDSTGERVKINFGNLSTRQGTSKPKHHVFIMNNSLQFTEAVA